MISQTFGRLTILDSFKSKYITFYTCLCICGKTTIIRKDHLLTGRSKSCGCLNSELLSLRSKTHGKTNSVEYKIWGNMIQRCYDKNTKSYKNYGGRGIKVCKRWKKFENFFADMGLRPSKFHSLDRIDSNKNYFSTNCMWSLKKPQMRNRTITRKVIFQNKLISIGELAEVYNLPYDRLLRRINTGWTVEDAVLLPKMNLRRKYAKSTPISSND